MTEPQNTSTVIVALPAETDPIHKFGPEQKHTTLLWLGEIDDPSGAHRAAEDLASNSRGPVTVKTTKVEGLGDDEPQAVVVKLDADMMPADSLAGLRHDLLTDPQVREQFEAQKQWPTFTPHVTLGYGDEVSSDDRAYVLRDVPQITFDRIAVWHKDEQTVYPLRQMIPERPMIAAVRYVRTSEGAERYGVPVGSKIETDKSGNVIKVNDKAPPKGRIGKKPPRKEELKGPIKFVPTVPGQKAKLPSTEALAAYTKQVGRKSINPSAPSRSSAPSAPSGSTPNSDRRAPDRTPSGGRRITHTGALSRTGAFNKALGGLSKQQKRLLERAQSGHLNKQDTKALRRLLKRTISKLTKSDGKKDSKQDDKKKKPKKQDKKPKKKQDGKKDKGKNKKDSDSFSQAEWVERLQKILKDLEGGGRKRKRVSGFKKQSSGSASTRPRRPAALKAPSAPAPKKKPKIPQSFTGMTDKQLNEAVRSLVAQKKSGDNKWAIDTALKKARVERRKRDKRRQEADARRKKLAGFG